MVKSSLIFKFAGIEGSLIATQGFRQDIKPSALSLSLDKARLKERSRRSQAFKAGKHDFKWKGGFLSGNVGQAIVQDGGSADHGISGLPVNYLITSLA